MILTNLKDCLKCSNAIIYGSMDTPTVNCGSQDYIHRNNFEKDGRACASNCCGYNSIEKSRDGRIEQSRALAFMLAGKCQFILHSTKTKEDFKFALTKKISNSSTDKNKFIYFLSTLNGNKKDYGGVVWYDEEAEQFRFGKGKTGNLDPNSLDVRSLIFVMNKLLRCETVQYLEVYHVGKCGCCGKTLTTPESILTGLGPTCAKKAGIPRIKLK